MWIFCNWTGMVLKEMYFVSDFQIVLFVEVWKTPEDANFPKPSYKHFKATN